MVTVCSLTAVLIKRKQGPRQPFFVLSENSTSGLVVVIQVQRRGKLRVLSLCVAVEHCCRVGNVNDALQPRYMARAMCSILQRDRAWEHFVHPHYQTYIITEMGLFTGAGCS